ncbi:UNVERIFIED_CONTAM: hypothetical protein K2H54_030587 [Gekko kuhli]
MPHRLLGKRLHMPPGGPKRRRPRHCGRGVGSHGSTAPLKGLALESQQQQTHNAGSVCYPGSELPTFCASACSSQARPSTPPFVFSTLPYEKESVCARTHEHTSGGQKNSYLPATFFCIFFSFFLISKVQLNGGLHLKTLPPPFVWFTD